MTGSLNLLFLPPFSIVARFFATACLFGVFGILLSVYMFLTGKLSLPAIIHTYTLGFAGMTMVGALFQMIPVVAGALIERPLLKATLVHLLLLFGTLLMVFGFAGVGTLLFGGVVTFAGFGLFLTFTLPPLLKLKSYTPTSRGMKFVLLNLGIGILMGILLLFGLGERLGLSQAYLLELHLSFMLIGWVTLLVISVAFQVVEMFFVTPPYPSLISRHLPPALTTLLFAKLLFPKALAPDIFIALLTSVFSLVTVRNLMNRRRKIRDPLVYLWYLAMVLLLVSSLLFPVRRQSWDLFILFLFFFGSFAQTVIMAMMYRIIPFLVWLHLTNKGVSKAPTMHEVIGQRVIWLHYSLHIIAIASFLTSLAFGEIVLGTCLLLYLLSFLLLTANILRGIFIYVKLSRT